MRCERAGELGLDEAVAGLVEVAVALEEVAGVGELGDSLCGVGEAVRFFVGEDVALGGEADGGRHVRARDSLP